MGTNTLKAVTTTTPVIPVTEELWLCPGCKMGENGDQWVCCDKCEDWFHFKCEGITEEPSDDQWYCSACTRKLAQAAKSSKLKKQKSSSSATPLKKQASSKKAAKKKK